MGFPASVALERCSKRLRRILGRDKRHRCDEWLLRGGIDSAAERAEVVAELRSIADGTAPPNLRILFVYTDQGCKRLRVEPYRRLSVALRWLAHISLDPEEGNYIAECLPIGWKWLPKKVDALPLLHCWHRARLASARHAVQAPPARRSVQPRRSILAGAERARVAPPLVLLCAQPGWTPRLRQLGGEYDPQRGRRHVRGIDQV